MKQKLYFKKNINLYFYLKVIIVSFLFFCVIFFFIYVAFHYKEIVDSSSPDLKIAIENQKKVSNEIKEIEKDLEKIHSSRTNN